MKCLFVYNPNSGKKKILSALDEVLGFLTSKFGEVEPYATKTAMDAYGYVKENVQNYDILVVSGGDGTLNECVSAVAKTQKEIPIAYIPSGTVNDVARTLEIPTNIKKCLKVIDKSQILPYDIMNVGDEFGLYVCCLGIFTETSYATSQKVKNIFGKLAYAFHFLKIWFKQKALRLEIQIGNDKHDGYFSCFFAVNSKSLSGFNINKHADMNDGNVDLFFIRTKSEKIRLLDKLRLFKVYLRGIDKVKENKYIKKYNAPNIKISSEENLAVNLDGEKREMKSFEINVIKDKIKFFRG